MSTRNLFYEELEKKFDIKPDDVKGWEVLLESVDGAELLIVHLQKPGLPTEYDPQFTTKEPALIRYAKITQRDIPLGRELPRGQILRRLFGLVNVYGEDGLNPYYGLHNLGYEQFKRVLSNESSEKLGAAVEMIEMEQGVGEKREAYTDYLSIRAYTELTKRFGSIPYADFIEDTQDWSTQDWVDYYTSIPSKKATKDVVNRLVFQSMGRI